MTAYLEELRRESRQTREAWRAGRATQSAAREAYEAYFRASCAAGRPPDAISSPTATFDEAIDSRIAAGADHDYWTGAIERGVPVVTVRDRTRRVRRWLWERAHGQAPDRYREIVEPICGEEKCVRVEHLVLVRREHVAVRDETILGALQVAASRLGRSPSISEWEAGDYRPSRRTIQSRFGTWNRALDAAGLTTRRSGVIVAVQTPETVDAALRAKAAELGREPTSYEWDEAGWLPSTSTIRRVAGSWAAATAAAGYSTGHVRAYTPEECLDAIRAKAAELGRVPTSVEWGRERWRPNLKAFRRLGGWSAAVRAAGFEPTRSR